MTDDELERHIRSLGELSRMAYEQGRRADAMEWQRLMREAIAARSPEQIQRMEADLDASLGYFADCGERDRRAMVGMASS